MDLAVLAAWRCGQHFKILRTLILLRLMGLKIQNILFIWRNMILFMALLRPRSNIKMAT